MYTKNGQTKLEALYMIYINLETNKDTMLCTWNVYKPILCDLNLTHVYPSISSYNLHLEVGSFQNNFVATLQALLDNFDRAVCLQALSVLCMMLYFHTSSSIYLPAIHNSMQVLKSWQPHRMHSPSINTLS